VARLQLHVAQQRHDFHHQTARVLVNRFGLIVIEDLNVKGLARSKLAKFALYLTDWRGW
jgi:putative transposase